MTPETQPDERLPNGRTKDDSLSPLPPEVKKVIEKLPDREAKGLLSIFLARSTTTFGPDPETAKILSDAEIHEEECRLKGFQASLQNRDKQSERDHEFRKKKLNHQFVITGVTLFVIICGVGTGLLLLASGNLAVGTPVLASSFAILSVLAGKILASRE